MSASSLACFGSTVTSAFCAAKFTFASVTPGTFESERWMMVAQLAQCMPSIASSRFSVGIGSEDPDQADPRAPDQERGEREEGDDGDRSEAGGVERARG